MFYKRLLITLLLSTSAIIANAKEDAGTVDQASILTGVTTFATLGTTSHPIDMIKSAKSDALAFIGSDGDIRSARFELAVRTYHSSYPAPHMNDMQLAEAIAASN
ncbi:DUF2388 domain-containing protein [Rhodococcus sp. IEGM1300]